MGARLHCNGRLHLSRSGLQCLPRIMQMHVAAPRIVTHLKSRSKRVTYKRTRHVDGQPQSNHAAHFDRLLSHVRVVHRTRE